MKSTLIKPMRVQRLRKKGFNLQEASRSGLPVKYVGRPTKWGNPFRVEDGQMYYYCDNRKILPHWILWDHERADYETEDAVELYEHWLRGAWLGLHGLPIPPDPKELRGKDLACWCPEDVGFMGCHADVLLDYANRRPVVRF